MTKLELSFITRDTFSIFIIQQRLMVLAFYKVTVLLLKVFTKPLIDHTKKFHLRNSFHERTPLMGQLFMDLGNWHEKMDKLISQKALGIKSDYAFKPLHSELAIERGINFFYELLFYVAILVISLFELNKVSKESKAKSKKQLDSIIKMQVKLINIMKEIELEKQLVASSKTKNHWLIRGTPRLAGKTIRCRFSCGSDHNYPIQYLL